MMRQSNKAKPLFDWYGRGFCLNAWGPNNNEAVGLWSVAGAPQPQD